MSKIMYGKTIENLRNRVDVSLLIYSKDYQKLVSKPSISSRKIFNKNLLVVLKKCQLLTN